MSTAVPDVSDKPTGPRSRKGVQTRARLVEAAKEIFEEQGFLDARISDIAERAGLSHGSFYHYFESKEALFREVAADVEERLSAPLGNVILDQASTAARGSGCARPIRRHLLSYRQEARIMGVIELMARYDPEVTAVRRARHRQYREQVAESIRQLQRRGMADRALDPVVAATGLGALTNRFAEMWFYEDSLDCSFDEGVEQLTRLLVNALQLTDRPSGGDGGRRRPAAPPSGSDGRG